MRHKVWLIEEPGGVFQERELPRPVPGINQVLVRIAASGVNPLDTKIRADAAAHARQPLPAVLCVDMAGTVEEASFARVVAGSLGKVVVEIGGLL